MIQTILFFVLGFLCAGFLALMVAPAFWRRAVSLTRKRVLATMPMTINEIQADKDKIRAEAALAIRRMEIKTKTLSERDARLRIDLGRQQEELRQATEQREERDVVIAGLETDLDRTRTVLAEREQSLAELTTRMDEAELRLKEQAEELERLGGLYEEASYAASGRQIELVAREAEIDGLKSDLAGLRLQRKDSDRRVRELASENKTIREELRGERDKAAELEARIEGMVAAASDLEERLERRSGEVARLREQLKATGGAGMADELAAAREDSARLEAELAEMSLQLALPRADGDDEIGKAIRRLSDDRHRLEARLSALGQENQRLRAELATAPGGEAQGEGSAVLREQIHDLAAQVVTLTAMLDRDASGLAQAIEDGGEEPRQGAGNVTSLADRVRALQKRAAAAE